MPLIIAGATLTIFTIVSPPVRAQQIWHLSIARNNHLAADFDCWRNGTCVAALSEGWGLAGYLLYSSDFGRTWTRVYEDSVGKRGRYPLGYGTVQYLSADEVIVTADSSYILHSEDGGRTWREKAAGEVRPGGAGPMAISNGETGVLVATRVLFQQFPERDTLLATRDRGETWYRLPNQPRENRYTANSPMTFVAAPQPGHFLVGFTETVFYDSALGKSSADSTVIFAYSSDTGNTWTYHTFRHDSVRFIRSPSVTFLNENEAVLTGLTKVGYSRRIVMRTHDAGHTWNVIDTGESSPTQSEGITYSHFETFDKGYGSRSGRLVRTSDGGRTWEQDSVEWLPGIGYQGVKKVYLFNDSLGVAMSDVGAFWYLQPQQSSVTEERSNSTPSATIWRRNSGPLPIHVGDHSDSDVRLSIWDVRGREVMMDVGEKISGRDGRILLDVGRFEPGFYAINVENGENHRLHRVLLVE